MASEDGAIEANLARAEPLCEEAAERGAQLVVLPEFLPTGYVYAPEIWDAAEPADGPTVRWLIGQAKRLGVHLGTSFLEAEEEDFYNTFVLAAPDGEVAGRVRKQTPAAYEAFFTVGAPGPHVIDTAIGRVGVAICYENVLAYTTRLMVRESADMLLMPHSAPCFSLRPLASSLLSQRYEEILASLAQLHAERLGVPTVMANKCGPWASPLPGLPMLGQRSRFPGLSAIADSDGRLLAQAGDEQAVLVEEVTLDPARKARRPPRSYGRWSIELPRWASVMHAIEVVGSVRYRLSRERRRRARAILARGR
ncbi:MAG: carbon-nitrogen hydrolase family protein [Deltaproteobacteria bacterium]|jgi:N-carbamoylputrescine amidase|nr:carbon-nitrogen hydrolase family protein [Deltaproteobacteria bacterium]